MPTATVSPPERTIADLPLPPALSWAFRKQLDAIKRFHLGGVWARDEAGPVAVFTVGPARLGPRLSPRIVMVSSAQGLHDALARKDEAVDKYGMFHEEFRKFGVNIFNMAHREWVPRKRALQPVFTKQRMEGYAGAMGTVVGQTVAGWAAQERLDLQTATRALTTEVLGRSLLGTSLGDRAGQIAADFAVFAHHTMSRGGRPVKAPMWLPTPQRRRYDRSTDRLRALARGAIEATREDPERDAPLIRQLLAAVDPETGRGIDEADLVWDLVTFILAGHDTTATTLAYALWQLGRHPAIQDAVADEAAALGSGTITPADVRALPLTVRVIHETLRLCPPGAGATRMAMQDVEIDGFRVPAGWNIVLDFYAAHRDPAHWDRPDDFDPDRFLPERSVGRDRWQFLPFGGGQRKCIGDHFAMLEATVALATLVRDLRFESLGDYRIEVGFTTYSGTPVPARVTRRQP